MASNENNGKRKLEEEVESSMVKKRLWLSDEDADSSEEETEEEEEVSSEETSMNQLDTSKEKLQTKCAHGVIFGNLAVVGAMHPLKSPVLRWGQHR
jgi:uncharacterized membrane protein YdbT with pleckstrin-like domain